MRLQQVDFRRPVIDRLLRLSRDSLLTSQYVDLMSLIETSLTSHKLTSAMTLLDALFDVHSSSSCSSAVKSLRRGYHVISARLEVGRAKILSSAQQQGDLDRRHNVNTQYDRCHERLIALVLDRLKTAMQVSNSTASTSTPARLHAPPLTNSSTSQAPPSAFD